MPHQNDIPVVLGVVKHKSDALESIVAQNPQHSLHWANQIFPEFRDRFVCFAGANSVSRRCCALLGPRTSPAPFLWQRPIASNGGKSQFENSLSNQSFKPPSSMGSESNG